MWPVQMAYEVHKTSEIFWGPWRSPQLTDTRCKLSFARLNITMKGAYPILLASKYSADCQRVYEKEILSDTPLLTLTWVYYSSMPTYPNLKLTPALKQSIMLNVVKTWRSLWSQRQCFIGPLASILFQDFELISELCALL